MTRIAVKPTLQPELFVYSFPVRVYFENTDAGEGKHVLDIRQQEAEGRENSR